MHHIHILLYSTFWMIRKIPVAFQVGRIEKWNRPFLAKTNCELTHGPNDGPSELIARWPFTSASKRPKLAAETTVTHCLFIPFMRLPPCRVGFLCFVIAITTLAEEQCNLLQTNSLQNKTKGFKDRLQRGEKLMQDEKLVSQNGQFALVVQSDGNIVQEMRRRDGSFWGADCYALWDPKSNWHLGDSPPGPEGGPYYLTIEVGDPKAHGRLLLYGSKGLIDDVANVWSYNHDHTAKCDTFIVQSDGNLVCYALDGAALGDVCFIRKKELSRCCQNPDTPVYVPPWEQCFGCGKTFGKAEKGAGWFDVCPSWVSQPQRVRKHKEQRFNSSMDHQNCCWKYRMSASRQLPQLRKVPPKQGPKNNSIMYIKIL